QTSLFIATDPTSLNNWIFGNARPYMQGRSLEIKSGKGEFAELFVAAEIPIHLSDPITSTRENLRVKFDKTFYVRAVHNIDIETADLELSRLKGVFDTLFAINIVEHGYFTTAALAKLALLLKPGGILVIIVPATTS